MAPAPPAPAPESLSAACSLDPNDAGEYRTKNVVYAEALTSLMCGECECE